jgi:hypothetical protein
MTCVVLHDRYSITELNTSRLINQVDERVRSWVMTLQPLPLQGGGLPDASFHVLPVSRHMIRNVKLQTQHSQQKTALNTVVF